MIGGKVRSLGRAIHSKIPALTSKLMQVASAMVFEGVTIASVAIIFPITIRALGPTGYGEYATMFAITGFAITWVFAGVGAAGVQLVLQRGRSASSVIRASQRQVVFATAPAALLGLITIALLLGPELLVPAAIIFVGELLVAGLAEVRISAIYARVGVSASVRIRCIRPILRVMAIVVLAWFGAVTIISIALVNLVVALVSLAAALAAVRPLLRADGQSDLSSTSRGELARLSGMYSTSISTNAVQDEGEKLILAATRPISEVGYYQAAYRVVSVLVAPIAAINVVATRWFLPHDDRPNAQVRKAILMTWPSLGYGLLCAIAIVVGEPLILWMLGPEFEPSMTIVMWLAVVPLLHALAEVPTLGLLGLNRNQLRVYLGVGTSSVAIIVYLALVPSIGWKGAILGTYISETTNIVVGWWLLVWAQRRADLDRTSAPGRHSVEHGGADAI